MENILSIPFKVFATIEPKNFFKKVFLFFIFTSILFVPLKFALGVKNGDVIINEVMWEGTPEWIELYNVTDQEINISNWEITNTKSGGKSLEIPGGKKILAKGYFLITDNNSDLNADFEDSISLKDKCDKNGCNGGLILKDDKKNEIDKVIGDEWPAGGEGISMERILKDGRAIDGLKKESWKNNDKPSPTGGSQSEKNSISFSAEAGGDVISLEGEEIPFDASSSKGDIEKYFWNFGDGKTAEGKTVSHKYDFAGEYYVSLKISSGENENEDLIKITIFSSSIFISEFLPNPKGGDSGKEWIEIVNESKQIQNISGWGISGSDEKINFIFPEGSYISPQGFLFLSSSLTKISLSNSEGSLFLFYPSGDICQEIKYEKIEENWSVARKNKDYFYTKNSTPGMINMASGDAEKEKGKSSSVLPESSFEGGENLEGEIKETQSLKTPVRKLLTNNLLAEAKRNQNALAFAGLSVGTFAGFFGFGLVKLRRKIKSGKQFLSEGIKKKPKKEIIEVEIEK